MAYTAQQIREMTDEELYTLSLKKKKNGCGTIEAYAAQRELQIRAGGGIRSHGWVNGSSKRYKYPERI